MKAQTQHSIRFKQIKSELVKTGRYQSYTLQDAVSLLTVSPFLCEVAQAETANDCLQATMTLKDATDHAVDQFVKLLVNGEREKTRNQHILRQNEMGHGIDPYLA